MAAEEQPPPTPQAALVQPEVPPVVRQQTPIAAIAPEDRTALLERFLHLRPPMFYGDYDLDKAESWVRELEHTFKTMDCANQNRVRLVVYQLKGFTQICHSGVDTVHLCVDTSSLSQKPVLKSCDPSFQEKVQGSEGQSLERALKFKAREQIQ
ncbi:hypothetical protein Taro_000302 [Colocasia esculenta]|uniref:Uncharacterized protein n=1 Tax=Colocasia esculenta TaxID=4460 RepID=A0A843TEK9_COLES|nr:hypothetical protein [Colocasia esculenta]